MFKSLRIQNFRSIKDSGTIELGPLNVFIGPNNSGKSSILATLLLLKQSLQDKDPETGLVTSGPFIDLGSYLDIVPKNPEKTPLSLSFTLDRSSLEEHVHLGLNEADEGDIGCHDSFELTFHYDAKRNNVGVHSFRMRDSSKNEEISGELQNEAWKLSGLPEDVAPHLTVSTTPHFIPSFTPRGRKPRDEALAQRVIGHFLRSILRAQLLSDAFERLKYVGPVRSRIPRYEVIGTTQFSEMVPSGQNLIRILAGAGPTQEAAMKALNRWLDDSFHVLKHIRLRKLDRGGTVRALVADDPTGQPNINLAATGSGISQLVPVVVQTVLTPRRGCLIVEQPEVHLHPGAQTTLADLFIERSSKGVQYIIETHSEHLLLRIRRRVAEGKIKPEAVRVFCVEKSEGWTKIRPLELGRNGHFIDWPKGFFEEGYEEAMALAQASAGLRRKTR